MPSKLINTKVPNVSDKDKRADEVGSDFVKKSYTRPWEIELTDEQRENLKRTIEEDEKNIKR